ncbi:MAG: hydroxyneurosporene methyltransferase [Thaumarchaeota archaeon]|nr:MAG: hydroxyneurosporene methyltransferase [Nitrososphaerota archaeon]
MDKIYLMSDYEKTLEIIFGRWRSQILYAGVKLGIFDNFTSDLKNTTDVARELDLDPALTYRLLRALGSMGFLKEDHNHRFSITLRGELLRKDHRQTLRGITLLEEGPEHYAIWKHLPEMIRDGQQNAFVREDTYDFSKILHLCDIGGGQGHLLCNLLVKYPHIEGTVLELESVTKDKELLLASKLGVSDRCSYIEGDMFSEVPSADAYIMKMILHDWNDDECIKILSNIHRSSLQNGKVFIAEHLVPDPQTPHFSKLFDIHMMCVASGRERTIEEYSTLLKRSGWNYVQTWFPQSRLMGVIEGSI